MKKSTAARRRRLERQELRELRLLRDRFDNGGATIDTITFTEISAAKFNVANQLNHKLILRPDWNGRANTWRVVAVRN